MQQTGSVVDEDHEGGGGGVSGRSALFTDHHNDFPVKWKLKAIRGHNNLRAVQVHVGQGQPANIQEETPAHQLDPHREEGEEGKKKNRCLSLWLHRSSPTTTTSNNGWWFFFGLFPYYWLCDGAKWLVIISVDAWRFFFLCVVLVKWMMTSKCEIYYILFLWKGKGKGWQGVWGLTRKLGDSDSLYVTVN